MTWIEYHEKQFSTRHNVLNLDHVEYIKLEDRIVSLKTDNEQYRLFYADETQARTAYNEIFTALFQGCAAVTIVAPREAWPRAGSF